MTLVAIPFYNLLAQDTDTELTLYTILGSSVKSGLLVSAGSGLTLNIATGYAIVKGHSVQENSGANITVPASTTSSVWLQILRNGSNQVTSVQYTIAASQPADSIYLADFTSGVSTISSVTDKRTIGTMIDSQDGSGNQVHRILANGGAVQGSAGMTIYEPLNLSKKIVTYNGSASVGEGAVVNRAVTFEKAETGADASIFTYTAPAGTDAMILLSIVDDISSITSSNHNIQATLTDSNGTVQTSQNIAFHQLGATGNVSNLTSVGDYEISLPFVLKAGTTLTIASTFSGSVLAEKISVILAKLY